MGETTLTKEQMPSHEHTVMAITRHVVAGGSLAVPKYLEGDTGSTGGSETHTHSVSGTVGETTLSVDQIAAHQHTQSTEGLQVFSGTRRTQRGWAANGAQSQSNAATVSNGGSQPHAHSLSGISSEAANSLPPYYALSFIMRIA